MNNLSNQIHEQFYKMRVGLFKQVSEQVSEQVNNQGRDKIFNQTRVQGVSRVKRVKLNVNL